jgi:hypothetical protein
MKILKNKTHRNLIAAVRKTELVAKKVLALESDYADLKETSELEITLLKQEVQRLNEEKLYVNFTRDEKGRIHSIKPTGKPRKRKTVPVPVPVPDMTPREFAELNKGKLAIVDKEECYVCGYDRQSVIVGFKNTGTGWHTTCRQDNILFSEGINGYRYYGIENIKL